jgi:hypothetical protein
MLGEEQAYIYEAPYYALFSILTYTCYFIIMPLIHLGLQVDVSREVSLPKFGAYFMSAPFHSTPRVVK